MAYSQTLNLVTGDTPPELTFTLKDSQSAASGKTLDENDASTWAPIDITGGSVKLRREGLLHTESVIICPGVPDHMIYFVSLCCSS